MRRKSCLPCRISLCWHFPLPVCARSWLLSISPLPAVRSGSSNHPSESAIPLLSWMLEMFLFSKLSSPSGTEQGEGSAPHSTSRAVFPHQPCPEWGCWSPGVLLLTWNPSGESPGAAPGSQGGHSCSYSPRCPGKAWAGEAGATLPWPGRFGLVWGTC